MPIICEIFDDTVWYLPLVQEKLAAAKMNSRLQYDLMAINFRLV